MWVDYLDGIARFFVCRNRNHIIFGDVLRSGDLEYWAENDIKASYNTSDYAVQGESVS